MNQPETTWAGAASHQIGEYFDCAKPYIDNDYAGMDPYLRFVSAQLFIDCHLTSESVLILVREAKAWDADLVARSVLEGTMKYVYMLVGTPEEMVEKAHEYWEIMPAFNAVKHSDRVKRLLDALPNPNNSEWQGLRELIISDEQAATAYQGTNKTHRQLMNQRWSFSGITKQFMEIDDSKLHLLAHLAHNYGMSSHLLHKDGDGVGMVWDRYGRDPKRQRAVALGHAARVVSDVSEFAKLRLFNLLRTCRVSTTCVQKIGINYQWLDNELKKARHHFNSVEYPNEIK